MYEIYKLTITYYIMDKNTHVNVDYLNIYIRFICTFKILKSIFYLLNYDDY